MSNCTFINNSNVDGSVVGISSVYENDEYGSSVYTFEKIKFINNVGQTFSSISATAIIFLIDISFEGNSGNLVIFTLKKKLD
jgi:hypothetical protein